MPDTEDDLRATSEALEDDGKLLATLERKKQAMGTDDPEIVPLSREIEKLVGGMARKARAERQLSEEIHGA